jgi:hypothetical protein
MTVKTKILARPTGIYDDTESDSPSVVVLILANSMARRQQRFSPREKYLISNKLSPNSTCIGQMLDVAGAIHSSTATRRARSWLHLDHLLSYALLTCGLLTFVVGAHQILSSHSYVPIWDEWYEIDAVATAPHHQPPISWLWAQHNEHRILFYRLLLLADIHFLRGNHWISFWSMFVVQCASLGLLAWLLRFGGLRGTLWRAATGLGTFCLFCPSQWENFSWAFQVSFLLPGFFLTLALLGLLGYEQSLRRAHARLAYLGLSILAASAATYSNGNGAVVWPTLLFVGAMLRLPLRVLATYVAAGVVLVGSYLYHYISPPYHSSPWESLHHPAAVLEYTAKYLGVILPQWMKIRSLVGASTGAVGLLAALVAAVWVLKSARWRRPLPVALLGLAFFSASTALITALGRVGFGTDQALRSRYQTFNLLFWFSVVTLWLIIVDDVLPFLRTAMLLAITVSMAIAGVMLFPLCIRAARIRTLQSEAAAVSLLTGVPDKHALEVLYDHPEIVWRDVDYLRQEHLFVFFDSWHGQMHKPLASVYRVDSQERCAGEVNLIERVPSEDLLTDEDSGGLRISGWAVSGLSENPVRRLVIAADGNIVGFAVGGFPLRTAADKVFLKSAKFVEWSGSVRPPSEAVSIDIYAVDNHGDGLCHIATARIPQR